MSGATFWLGRAAGATFVLALVLACLELFGTPRSAGRVALARYSAELEQQLRFLRIRTHGRTIARGQALACTALLVVAGVAREPLLCLAIPGLLLVPKVILGKRRATRINLLEEQIEPWLNAIANALKASPSLGEAISASASLVGSPMSQEIDVVVKEYELGTPLDRALENFSTRMRSKTLGGCVLALKIARKSGGNLPEMLESAAAALREMARLEGVVRTKTAEGKAQAFVIGMIPVPLVIGINWMDPSFMAPLFETFTGHLILGAVGVLWALAILLARKILDVDI